MAEPGKVVSLEVRKSEPIPELIEFLEKLTEEARSGELRSLIHLNFKRDGSYRVGRQGEQEEKVKVIGAIELFKMHLHTNFEEADGG